MPSRRFVLLLLAVLLLIPAPIPPAAAQTQSRTTAYDMLAALNAWRLEQNLWPLRPNPTLEALAWLQLDYLLAQPNLPARELLHDGLTGEKPRDRALWAPYNWPYYTIPARVSLEEITVAQRTVERGITWWKNSPVHNAAATNPNYREVGVAALPYAYGTVFVAVLAGRPNVLPALLHPDGKTLYLTRETYSGARGGGYLANVTGVRVLDSDGTTPLIDWRSWQPTLTLPRPSGNVITVEYTDGRQTVRTEVDRTRDIFPLPDYVDALRPTGAGMTGAASATILTARTAGDRVAAAGAELALSPDSLLLRISTTGPLYLANIQFLVLQAAAPPTIVRLSDLFGDSRAAGPGSCFLYQVTGRPVTIPQGCTGQVVLQQVAPEGVFWYDSAQAQAWGLFVVSDRGKPLADCRTPGGPCLFNIPAGAAPAGAAGGALPVTRQVRLIYDANSFTLLNIGGQRLDISGLSFSNGTQTLHASVWNTPSNTASLYSFPSGDCLQVWPQNVRQQAHPTGCKVRHAWVAVRANQTFWTGGAFEVRASGTTIGTCQTEAGECVVDLP